MMVKLEMEPRDVVLVQVYFPTSAHEEEEVEKMYEKVEELLCKEKGSDFVVVMGDFNAVVGEGRDESVVGKFGLGTRNERGNMLVEFCKRKKLVVANTWFEHNYRRRYTWRKPGDNGNERFQIDYILVKERYRNSVKDARTYPGADMDSDHNLLVSKLQVKLKKIRKGRREKRWNLDKLRCDRSVQEKFVKGVEEDIRNKKQLQENIEGRWGEIKEVVIRNAEKYIGYEEKKKVKKPWISEEMIRKMDERRRWKRQNTEYAKKKYKELNNELRRVTQKAREDWWCKKCLEMDELQNKGQVDLLYKEIRQVTGKNRKNNKNNGLKDKQGRELTTEDEIQERWREYIKDLYDTNHKPAYSEMELESQDEIEDGELGLELMREEIEKAIDDMKGKKAVGVDNIPAEFWKVMEGEARKELTGLCQEIYLKGKWPKDFTKTIMIPIPKKGNAEHCADYRTISLIPHISKILLKVLCKRIESKASDFISRSQFGFRKGVGTRDAIGVLRMLVEKILDFDKDLYICFIDYEKAFDMVNWVKLMRVLRKIGVSWRERKLIEDLYMTQEVMVRVNGKCTEGTEIGRGVR